MEENSLCAVPGHVSRLADAEQTALTDARHAVQEHVLFLLCFVIVFFSEVLTERVDKKWVCSNSHSFGSSDGFFNKGLTTAVLK